MSINNENATLEDFSLIRQVTLREVWLYIVTVNAEMLPLNLWTSWCTIKCLSIGTPKTINFPFVPNGKLMVLDVPIF